MFNPYSILAVPNYEKMSLKNPTDTMMLFWNAPEDIFSEEEREQVTETLKSDLEDYKKKEIIFDKLTKLNYHRLTEKYQKRIENTQVKLERERRGKDREKIEKLEESLEKYKKNLKKLSDAYEMIKNEKGRRLYGEKKIAEEQSLEQIPEEKTAEEIWQSYEASVKRCEELSRSLQNDTIRTRERTDIQKEIRRGLFTDSPTLTKGMCTIDLLSQIAEKNKNRIDPENQFEQYTGIPYRWGFVETRLPNACIINETNIENERVIVIRLGKFLYETFIQSPTEQYPEGKAIYQDSADIIGVSKLDANNQLVRNDIVIARLDSKDPVKDQRYFKEVFVSNRRIDEANLCNNGFIGGILKDENNQCYIEYNHISDSDLVTALEVAKYTGAKKCKNWPTEKVYTFPKIKETFKKMQEYYTESMIERANKPKVKGEKEWEK